MEAIQVEYPFQEASRIKRHCANMSAESIPGWELFSMLGGINKWLGGASPYIQNSLLKNAVSVYVLYRNVAYTPDDLWDLFGLPMARINRIWPICAFGTAENQETVRLTAETEKNGVQLIQQSISGRRSDVLRTLCFQIECTDNQTAQLLVRLLTATNWETNIMAMNDWRDVGFLREQNLFIQTDLQGLFCYGSVNRDVATREMLFSLNFEQKMLLWTAFLKDGFDPAEFEWMSDEITDGALDNRLEWELALWEALDQLGFQMVNREKTFEVFDGAGRRHYFGADGGSAAQHVFLKILFPLNY